MGILLTLIDPGASPLLTRALLANMYAVGFIFVILGRSELFTEHTTLAVFPVLRGDASLRQLGRLWGLVYAANLAGTVVFAFFVTTLGSRMGLIAPEAFAEISHERIRHDSLTIFMSAVAAGWLMGILSSRSATRPAGSRWWRRSSTATQCAADKDARVGRHAGRARAPWHARRHHPSLTPSGSPHRRGPCCEATETSRHM
jgi:hypothetical protein